MAVDFLLVHEMLNTWFMAHINFALTYTQTPIGCEIYMTLPHGITTWYVHAKDYILKLINNICGQKQAGKIFVHYRDKV